MKNPTTVRFLFDYISPYAYLGWTQLPRLIKQHAIDVQPVPVLFAGLLNAHGQKGPAEIPAKRHWLIENVIGLAANLGVPIAPPAYHPFNPLLPLRATIACQTAEESWNMMGACFRGVWQAGIHLADAHAFAAWLDHENFDGAKAVDRAARDSAKQQLRTNTSDAVAAGVFGVPSFVLDGQIFWGVSDIALLEQTLREEAVLDRSMARHWRETVQPSATRSGIRKEKER